MPFCWARRSSAALGPPNRPVRPGAAAEIHYGPSEDLEEIDVALIHEAAKQIDDAGYVLTDSAVIEARRAAAEHGVKVRIWRDASEAARLSAFSSAAASWVSRFVPTRLAAN